MALEARVTGTVTAADLTSLTIRRDGSGDLLGTVSVKINIEGIVQQRTYEWTLTQSQKNAIVSGFLPDAILAARTGLGL